MRIFLVGSHKDISVVLYEDIWGYFSGLILVGSYEDILVGSHKDILVGSHKDILVGLYEDILVGIF